MCAGVRACVRVYNGMQMYNLAREARENAAGKRKSEREDRAEQSSVGGGEGKNMITYTQRGNFLKFKCGLCVCVWLMCMCVYLVITHVPLV